MPQASNSVAKSVKIDPMGTMDTGTPGPLPEKSVVPSTAPSGTVTRSLLMLFSRRSAASPARVARRFIAMVLAESKATCPL